MKKETPKPNEKELKRQLKVARKIMRENREALRTLAK
jgi:hypothetical protein